MNKMVFYEERTFGDKFNVIFEFIKQNWRPILRYVSYEYRLHALAGMLFCQGAFYRRLLRGFCPYDMADANEDVEITDLDD